MSNKPSACSPPPSVSCSQQQSSSCLESTASRISTVPTIIPPPHLLKSKLNLLIKEQRWQCVLDRVKKERCVQFINTKDVGKYAQPQYSLPLESSFVDASGSLAIHLAIENDAPHSVISSLISVNRNGLKETNGDGVLPLHLAIKHGARSEIISELMNGYKFALFKTHEFGSPLIYAIQQNARPRIISQILNACPKNLKEKNAVGMLPLHLAVQLGLPAKIVSELINGYKAALREKTLIDGYIPLHIACMPSSQTYPYERFDINENMAEIIKLLMESDLETIAMLNEGSGSSILHMVCEHKPPKHLISTMIQLSKQFQLEKTTDVQGQIPLHVAVEYHTSYEVVRRLLQAYPEGAQQKRIKEGFLPLHCAAYMGCEEKTLQLLMMKYPAAVTSMDTCNKNTPLHTIFLCYHENEKWATDGSGKSLREGLLDIETMVKFILSYYVQHLRQKRGTNTTTSKADKDIVALLNNKRNKRKQTVMHCAKKCHQINRLPDSLMTYLTDLVNKTITVVDVHVHRHAALEKDIVNKEKDDDDESCSSSTDSKLLGRKQQESKDELLFGEMECDFEEHPQQKENRKNETPPPPQQQQRITTNTVEMEEEEKNEANNENEMGLELFDSIDKDIKMAAQREDEELNKRDDKLNNDDDIINSDGDIISRQQHGDDECSSDSDKKVSNNESFENAANEMNQQHGDGGHNLKKEKPGIFFVKRKENNNSVHNNYKSSLCEQKTSNDDIVDGGRTPTTTGSEELSNDSNNRAEKHFQAVKKEVIDEIVPGENYVEKNNNQASSVNNSFSKRMRDDKNDKMLFTKLRHCLKREDDKSEVVVNDCHFQTKTRIIMQDDVTNPDNEYEKSDKNHNHNNILSSRRRRCPRLYENEEEEGDNMHCHHEDDVTEEDIVTSTKKEEETKERNNGRKETTTISISNGKDSMLLLDQNTKRSRSSTKETISTTIPTVSKRARRANYTESEEYPNHQDVVEDYFTHAPRETKNDETTTTTTTKATTVSMRSEHGKRRNHKHYNVDEGEESYKKYNQSNKKDDKQQTAAVVKREDKYAQLNNNDILETDEQQQQWLMTGDDDSDSNSNNKNNNISKNLQQNLKNAKKDEEYNDNNDTKEEKTAIKEYDGEKSIYDYDTEPDDDEMPMKITTTMDDRPERRSRRKTQDTFSMDHLIL